MFCFFHCRAVGGTPHVARADVLLQVQHSYLFQRILYVLFVPTGAPALRVPAQEHGGVLLGRTQFDVAVSVNA